MRARFNGLKWIILLALITWPFQRSLSLEAGFDVQLRVIGGAHRMFRSGVDHPALEVTAWSTDGKDHDVEAVFRAEDFFGHPAAGKLPEAIVHVTANGSRSKLTTPLDFGTGYYLVSTKCSEGEAVLIRSSDLGIVYPPYPGARPNSLFASNLGLKQGEDLQFLQTIGMKVLRSHFEPPVKSRSATWPAEFPSGEAVPLDFGNLDQTWNDVKVHGLWVLPIVGYSLPGAGKFDRTSLAEELKMYGPPNDEARFVRTWQTILRHYPEITTYEFWNEPWVFEWTWASTPEDYRHLQSEWCSMALQVNPRYRLLAGNSAAFVRDNIEPFNASWDGLLSGVTHHPYTMSALQPNWRRGDLFRSIDEIRMAANDMGLPYAYLTEGGTGFAEKRSADDPEPYNNRENAEKLVQYYAAAALAGDYMGNAQWQIGYGPGWTRSNTAFAVMTHFLEDRVPLVDLWPQQELLWGGIFANWKFVGPAIKALPRANELSARWEVEVPRERADDKTKVAVIWGLTGSSPEQLDTDGQLVILDASDLHAYNLVGQEILPDQGKLILPLSGAPIYITTENLGVLEFRDRIQLGVIRRVTPVNLYAFSLPKPASDRQDLSVRIENQINRYLRGTLVLHAAGSDETSSARFQLQGGELAEVQVPWPGVPISTDNRYQISLTVHFDDDCASLGGGFAPINQRQVISVATFAKRTVRFTGKPSDWDNLTPVTIDSDFYRQTADSTAALLNPSGSPKPDEAIPERIVGQFFTAYDDDAVYLGAEVHQNEFQCSAGEPVVKTVGNSTVALPYKRGVPDGLDFITQCGDVFQFGFGFRDRVPGIGRQMGDPWAWKGAFYDTDYSFVAHASTDGDKLLQIWGSHTSRRNGYQAEAVPGIESVPGAEVKIVRDDTQKLTLYEIAIPRVRLALFNPSMGRCRFGFILFNSGKVARNALAWSDVAGVFDYWETSGSYPPTWRDHLPCQTFFGIQQ